MSEYLDYHFNDTPEFVETFDELPLWSASFGLLLLKHLELKPGFVVMDVGSGSGFPLMELAGRLGSSCKLYGLDPWTNANERARKKIKNYGISNVEIVESSAEQIPFEDNSLDLIVSNLGINNFNNPPLVFRECNRILKPKGRLALTTNLNGHWREFYTIFEETLKQCGQDKLIAGLRTHQEHRGTVESVSKLYTDSGFNVRRHYKESFEMKFLDGSAFLNHYFVKLGWLSSWRDLLPPEKMKEIFMTLEQNLNSHAQRSQGLSLTVPMLFMEAEKRA